METRYFSLALVIVVWPAVLSPAQKPQPSSRDIAKIESAAPAEAAAEPDAPRRLLVFSKTNGWYHKSIPWGKKAMEVLGKKTGAFDTLISDDIGNFEPDRIREFDAICLLNTTGNIFMPHKKELEKMSPDLRQAAEARARRIRDSFLHFIKNGGGLVGIHSATDTLYNWAEYGQMIGGYFNGHPWTAGDTVGVTVSDPTSPLTKPFAGSPGFMVKDEIYEFKNPYSRDRLHVLLELDKENTDMEKKGIKRKDGDFPISWIQNYGKGRIYYCSLGHNKAIYWHSGILRYYLNGIQFAFGDLDAPEAPRP